MLKTLKFFIFLAVFGAAHSDTAQNTLQCTAIFEARKGELAREVEKLYAKKSEFEAFFAAKNDLIAQQEAKISMKNQDLEKKLSDFLAQKAAMEKDFARQKQDLEKLLAENQKILSEISGAAQKKIAETYAKMKDARAAAILEDMDFARAAEILFALKAQDVAKILAKMDAKKAAILTELLKNGPPFGQKSSQNPPDPKDSTAPVI